MLAGQAVPLFGLCKIHSRAEKCGDRDAVESDGCKRLNPCLDQTRKSRGKALDTPDLVVTCRAVCTMPLAGATCPSWERPLASREACQGPGDRRKLSNPRDATGARKPSPHPAW